MIVLAGGQACSLLGSYFSGITDWSEVAAQLRDSSNVDPTCSVSSVEVWACVVDS